MLRFTLALFLVACFYGGAVFAAKDTGIEFPDDQDEAHNYAECEVHSSKYSKWFLHSEKFASKGDKRNVTLRRFVLFSDKKQSTWKMVPVERVKNGFHIKNSKYGEQIFATSSFTGVSYFYWSKTFENS